MDRLPTSLLYSFCGLLWDDCPRTVRILSLVNSAWYDACVPHIYSKISFRLESDTGLREELIEIHKNPLRKQCLTYTGILTLDGAFIREGKDDEETKRLSRVKANLLDNLAKREADICSASDLSPPFDRYFASDKHEAEIYEDWTSPRWDPLVAFISELQHLVELNYDCLNAFPPGILVALHEHHPSCRLSVNTFRLRSLNEPKTDHHEIDLLRSPCLHAINDFNEEAARAAVAIAPNLKHVRLQKCMPKFKGTWKGFIPPLQHGQVGQKRELTTLSLSGYGNSVHGDKPRQWGEVVDLSKLVSLSLPFQHATLKDILLGSRFDALEKLDMNIALRCGIAEQQQVIDVFFNELPPLKALRLRGAIDHGLIETAMTRHGPTLLELQLHPFKPGLTIRSTADYSSLTPSVLETVAELCPLLEQLDVNIPRSSGDRTETSYYEAISKFQRLKHIHLHLYYSMEPLQRVEDIEEPLDDFDKQTYDAANGRDNDVSVRIVNIPERPQVDLCAVHVRDVFMNAAVDSTLARSIWDTIVSSTPRQNLQTLRIYPHISQAHIMPSSIITKIEHMERAFKVEWEGYGSEVDITELCGRIRERRDAKEKAFEARMVAKWGPLEDERDGDRKIMRRIWPERAHYLDWRDRWCSLPLQRTGRSCE
ncbi:hypothetical protein BDV25DRAFT_128787 [Aspergillus avenaceus]|uniref:Uncharacterized protein n=1 Tax=Aspergillus avenaceus TaxID=36643 RepID=A0A5N6TYJ6_ASPAV|nr:hypothetical protein BDV25DRAFT_128787 [Aspergillus avenaceus]